MRLRSLLALCAATATAVSVLGVPAGAQETSPKVGATKASHSDIREIPSDRQYRLAPGLRKALRAHDQNSRSALAAGETPPIGTVRQWIALDDVAGRLYRKDYTLRGVGRQDRGVGRERHAPSRPATAERRSPQRTNAPITDAQVAELVERVRQQHVPARRRRRSARRRTGTAPTRILGPDASGNGGDYTGDGDKTVTLVDNVRDDNFYDFPAAPTYIAGFFSSQFNELFDRNVMTIDAFDWLHRTGAEPAGRADRRPVHQPPGAGRSLYEGMFAHEWQHLLQYYTDPFEVNLVNEGLSDFAQTLTGYVDADGDGVRPGRRQPPLLLPGLRHGADAVQPEPAGLRWARRTR